MKENCVISLILFKHKLVYGKVIRSLKSSLKIAFDSLQNILSEYVHKSFVKCANAIHRFFLKSRKHDINGFP